MSHDPHHDASATPTTAPHPGVASMPQWNVGELPEAPVFAARNWVSLLGPALLMAGAAIGGGEWLAGPAVTARYGGNVMWLATFSILAQVVYNLEISRYTLYSGEPIFTGKFRTIPGPHFWVFVYLLLDLGSVFPYLAANAATPIGAIWLGAIPDPENNESHKTLLKALGVGVFLLAFLPSIFGGKIYNTLKAVMGFKVVTVLTFLLVLGFFYAKPTTWIEVFSGFFKIGNVPIQRDEDVNQNGVLDPGEDWDGDGRLDVVEPLLLSLDTNGDKKKDAIDLNGDGQPDPAVKLDPKKPNSPLYPDLDGDGRADLSVEVTLHGERKTVSIRRGAENKLFLDYDGDGIRDGDNIENVFVSFFSGRGIPTIDLSMIAFLCAFAAIAGSGGLSNTPTSNYTRDQGWGMGAHVGAIPSLFGGHQLTLSHVGTVFLPTAESLLRWKAWYKHIMRDQLVIWMPACFFGIALPSMLSVEFLQRGVVADGWVAAGMTAGGVRDKVTSVSGSMMGHAFWYMTLVCGFLVLAPTMASTAEGYIRRWVDVFWTASARLRKLDPSKIRYVYFSVLIGYMAFGLMCLLVLPKPEMLVKVATNIMNFALGFSCWHTLYLNLTLLPKEVRPGWFVRIAMFTSGFFFWTLASVTTLREMGYIN